MTAEEVSPDSVTESPAAPTVGVLSDDESWLEEMAPDADADSLSSPAVPSDARCVTAMDTVKVSLDSISMSSVVLTVKVLSPGESWVKESAPAAGA